MAKQAGAYLYEKVANKNGSTRYFVGVYTNGADGKSKPFERINDLAGDINHIIRDERVAKLGIVSEGETVTGYRGEKVLVAGPGRQQEGATPGITFVQSRSGEAQIYMMDPSRDYGYLGSNLMSDGEASKVYASDALAHEFGHVLAEWGLVYGPTHAVAVALENEARRIRDPNAPTRTGHDLRFDAMPPWKWPNAP